MQDESSVIGSVALGQKEYDLFSFRIRALQEVNQRLSLVHTQTSDSTLMCVICLLVQTVSLSQAPPAMVTWTHILVQMQQSAYTDWRVHLEGARRIIQLRGGLKEIVKENPFFKPLLAFFIV